MDIDSFEIVKDDGSKFRDKIEIINGDFYLKKLWKGNHIGKFSSREEARTAALILKNNDWNISYFINNNFFRLGNTFYIFKLIGNQIKSEGVSSNIEDLGLEKYKKSFKKDNIKNQNDCSDYSDDMDFEIIENKGNDFQQDIDYLRKITTISDIGFKKNKQRNLKNKHNKNFSKKSDNDLDKSNFKNYDFGNFDVYYKYNYYSSNNKHSKIDIDDRKFTDNLGNYKRWNEKTKEEHANGIFNDFTEVFLEFIIEFSKKSNKENIVLVAAPSSKRNKINSVAKSINKIKQDFDNGIIEKNYAFDKNIEVLDVLKRIESIKPSHSAKSIDERPAVGLHMKTIKCKDDLSKYDAKFIIMDDLVTLSRTFTACRNILIENGVPENEIALFALGKTAGGF